MCRFRVHARTTNPAAGPTRRTPWVGHVPRAFEHGNGGRFRSKRAALVSGRRGAKAPTPAGAARRLLDCCGGAGGIAPERRSSPNPAAPPGHSTSFVPPGPSPYRADPLLSAAPWRRDKEGVGGPQGRRGEAAPNPSTEDAALRLKEISYATCATANARDSESTLGGIELERRSRTGVSKKRHRPTHRGRVPVVAH